MNTGAHVVNSAPQNHARKSSKKEPIGRHSELLQSSVRGHDGV